MWFFSYRWDCWSLLQRGDFGLVSRFLLYRLTTWGRTWSCAWDFVIGSHTDNLPDKLLLLFFCVNKNWARYARFEFGLLSYYGPSSGFCGEKIVTSGSLFSTSRMAALVELCCCPSFSLILYRLSRWDSLWVNSGIFKSITFIEEPFDKTLRSYLPYPLLSYVFTQEVHLHNPFSVNSILSCYQLLHLCTHCYLYFFCRLELLKAALSYHPDLILSVSLGLLIMTWKDLSFAHRRTSPLPMAHWEYADHMFGFLWQISTLAFWSINSENLSLV